MARKGVAPASTRFAMSAHPDLRGERSLVRNKPAHHSRLVRLRDRGTRRGDSNSPRAAETRQEQAIGLRIPLHPGGLWTRPQCRQWNAYTGQGRGCNHRDDRWIRVGHEQRHGGRLPNMAPAAFARLPPTVSCCQESPKRNAIKA